MYGQFMMHGQKNIKLLQFVSCTRTYLVDCLKFLIFNVLDICHLLM